MTQKTMTEAIAEKIADDLFVDSRGRRAAQLRMVLPTGALSGGWDEDVFRERIEKTLQEFLGDEEL